MMERVGARVVVYIFWSEGSGENVGERVARCGSIGGKGIDVGMGMDVVVDRLLG